MGKSITDLSSVTTVGLDLARSEAALEAERERPVKAPLRVSLDGRGEPVVTLDTETRKQVGVEVITPQGTSSVDPSLDVLSARGGQSCPGLQRARKRP